MSRRKYRIVTEHDGAEVPLATYPLDQKPKAYERYKAISKVVDRDVRLVLPKPGGAR